MMLEGVNRIRSTAWFQPWSNVAAELTDIVNFNGQKAPWTHNIRIFLSFDQSLETSKEHEHFIQSCGAFVEHSKFEHFKPPAIHYKPVNGYVSGETWSKWTQRDSIPQIIDHNCLSEKVSPKWLLAVQSDINHLLHLGLSISEAENIRINLPNTYVSQKTSLPVSNAPNKVVTVSLSPVAETSGKPKKKKSK